MSIVWQKNNDGIEILDIVWYGLIYSSKDYIYIVYDDDESFNEINQKTQMQKLTKGSMITYINN